jgi:hypothetical protein
LIRRSPARGDGDVDEHGNKIVSYAIWFRADENLPGINLRKRELVSVNYDLDRPGGSYHCFYAGTGKFALQFLEDVIAADGFVHLGDSTPGEKK